jgi:hypothetical protein
MMKHISEFLPPYSSSNNARSIVLSAIEKANKMHNPSYDLHVEELSGQPNDRSAYDYAGSEPENQIEHDELVNNK